MSESFADLFAKSEKTAKSGSIVIAKVIDVRNGFVTVDVGLKSEGFIDISEFVEQGKQQDIKPGDEVHVFIEAVEDGSGSTKLSREKAKKAETWAMLAKSIEDNKNIIGVITDRVKGGFTVELDGIKAFLPGSLVDVRPLRDTSHIEGVPIEFKLMKIDQKRNNVVVSRKHVIESESGAERSELLKNLQEGAIVEGMVKNLTDYGAFIDFQGIDGLLHITDISWKRIKHPSEVLQNGQKLTVKVLKFDEDKKRVSLGLKQLTQDPWANIKERYPNGTIVKAKVTNLAEYGCFAEIENGVEGLVHVSEMDWTNKNIHPSKVVGLGDEVNVMVLDIDEEKHRISLGIKQTKENPWILFANKYKTGDKVLGSIKSITDFGVFIGLEFHVDGLIHVSDLSWNESGEELLRKYKKGDELEAIIMTVDAEKERISLSIKQLSADPFNAYVDSIKDVKVLKGNVTEVDDQRAKIQLSDDIFATLKLSEIPANVKVELGSEVEAQIISIDRKNRAISLSVKALEDLNKKAAMEAVRKKQEEEVGPTSIGALIKQKMEE